MPSVVRQAVLLTTQCKAQFSQIMETVETLITDEEIKKVWGSANFGSMSNRDIIKGALLKCASGYYTGHTAKSILCELGLVNKTKWELTKLGKQYLFAAYSGGVSV